jgi:putative ABC transport system permease protein
MRLVAIALVLSSSIAGYLMQKWLENFAYPINLSWWIFALAGVFSILLAFVAIGYPAIKAALTDPVKNLRTE